MIMHQNLVINKSLILVINIITSSGETNFIMNMRGQS